MVNTIHDIQSVRNPKDFLPYKDCSPDLIVNRKYKLASMLVIYTH
jgi:hypothetical protein